MTTINLEKLKKEIERWDKLQNRKGNINKRDFNFWVTYPIKEKRKLLNEYITKNEKTN